MSEKLLENSLYSRPFKILRYLGMWHIDDRKVSIYHQFLTIFCTVIISTLFIFDFKHHFGNFKKITFNLSFSIVFIPEVFKHYYVTKRLSKVNYVRRKLHESWLSRNSDADEEINSRAKKEVKFLYTWFYSTYWICIPVGLYLFYVKTTVDFPFPLRPPFKVDFTDPFQYNVAFFTATTITCLVFLFILEEEMVMFTLLIQISREYRVLIKDIYFINQIYDESEESRSRSKSGFEVNPTFQIKRSKKWLKKYCNDQKKIIE